jgi:dCMP deaminase
MGYNGFPRGTKDDPELYLDRPRKHLRIVHAEANAILTAHGSTAGACLYVVPLCPCATCAGLIIQAGIVRVVCRMPHLRPEWAASFMESQAMFQEAGVEFVHHA